MLSSPTPSDRRTRSIAGSALKSVGLVDRDARMHDVNDKHGGRKGTQKKVGHRHRVMDALRGAAGLKPHSSLLASRIAGASSSSDLLTIRGASKVPTGIRTRKNAISGGSEGSLTSNHRVPTKTLDVWRQFVQRRWNAEARFLNLERMVDDEILKKHNILPPGVPGSSSREMAVILKMASQLKPEVQTISLANNNFESGSYLSFFAHYVPRLSNLSLQNNRLKGWRDLDSISARKGRLQHLRELVLIGNPLRELELKNGRGEFYKAEMAKRFPSLEVLDQESIATISFDIPLASTSHTDPQAPRASSFPLPMGPSFIVGVEGSVVSNFLTRFFPLFDNQRAALMDVYAPNATFSFSAVTNIPDRARVQGLHHSKELPNQKKLDWSPWLMRGSRNLTKLGGGTDKVMKSLHIGPEEIVKGMTELPGTRHDVTGVPEKFCVDAWPVGQGDSMLLFISVHGEFAEAPTQGLRSFDRSFVLGPALAGSRAKMADWDVVILSDQLVVRALSSHLAWAPGPLRMPNEESSQQHQNTKHPQSQVSASQPQPQVVNALANLPLDVLTQFNIDLASIPDPQRSMVLTICQRTGLNLKFAVDCLEGNGWDLERAVGNFEQVKASLTREAFL